MMTLISSGGFFPVETWSRPMGRQLLRRGRRPAWWGAAILRDRCCIAELARRGTGQGPRVGPRQGTPQLCAIHTAAYIWRPSPPQRDAPMSITDASRIADAALPQSESYWDNPEVDSNRLASP